LVADDVKPQHHLVVLVEDVVTMDHVFREKVSETQDNLHLTERVETQDVLLATFVILRFDWSGCPGTIMRVPNNGAAASSSRVFPRQK
jgi:hypothetical protein